MSSLQPFRDDVFRIGKTLVAIATETEQIAERFRRDKTQLDDGRRYHRFHVDRGLEEVGLGSRRSGRRSWQPRGAMSDRRGNTSRCRHVLIT